MFLYIKIALLSTFVFLLTACNSSDYKSQSSSNTLHGVVVDGYINSSHVCLDINANGKCDSNEPETSTDSNGVFQFQNLESSLSGFVPIIASYGIDTSTQKSFLGEIKNILDLSQLNEDTTIVISPLTDLIATAFLASDQNQSFALQQAKTRTSDVLGIAPSDLNSDPMKNITIFSKSQEIQHTKHLIETSAKKSKSQTLTPTQEKDLQTKIKKELLNQNFNLTRVLIAMEVYLHTTIPENEKNFIIAQLSELKNSLNTLSQDTSLDIDNLNRLQKSIDLKQEQAIEQLLDANATTTLNVVAIDETTESITKSIFNREDALLDENACKMSQSYNMLAHSSFAVDKSEDSANGISLVSEYPRGDAVKNSEVQIYYPNLQTAKSFDDTIVFQESYYFVFDKSWLQNSERTIYIRTPQAEDGLYSCYRFELNFSTATNVKGTKVFRYQDI